MGLLAIATTTLNFVVTGNVRSGTAVLQSALTRLPEIVCHGDLFSADASARTRAHARYFGSEAEAPPLKSLPLSETSGSGPPLWNGDPNPCHYLSEQIFDQPRCGESAVGVRIPYAAVLTYELADYFGDCWREGDFCVIHVERNPIACFVSYQQALRSRLWSAPRQEALPLRVPSPLTVDAGALTAFVREHEAAQRRLAACCPDQLRLSYRDLVWDYDATLERVLEFLEQPPTWPLPRPATWRLRNHPLEQRLANLPALRRQLPYDARAFLDDETLF